MELVGIFIKNLLIVLSIAYLCGFGTDILPGGFIYN